MSGTGTGGQPSGADILFRPERVEAALWRRHRDLGCIAARQSLFDHYRRFAERLAAGQFAKRRAGNFDRADVQQLAYEGLIHAIERFDPSRGVPFEAYARIRIQGHISDGLSRTSEAAAQSSYRLRQERERLRSLQEGLENTDEDPLAALSSLSATIAIGLLAETVEPGAIEEVPDPAPSAYENLAWNGLLCRVHELIDGLPEREAFVMRQHYRHGVSFQHIAGLLGVTKGRVSQIHRAALNRLRGLLAKHI